MLFATFSSKYVKWKGFVLQEEVSRCSLLASWTTHIPGAKGQDNAELSTAFQSEGCKIHG